MSAVEEYRKWPLPFVPQPPPDVSDYKLGYRRGVIASAKYADAAIAELEAENGRQLGEIDAEDLACKFHDVYEGAADAMDYATRPESAVPWGDVPQPNKALMIATAAEVLAWLRARIEGKKP